MGEEIEKSERGGTEPSGKAVPGNTDVLRRRIAARCIDLAIGFSFVVLIGPVERTFPSNAIVLFGLAALLYASLVNLLFMEGLWNGYTVGKRLLGIRVVTEEGDDIGVRQALKRHLSLGGFTDGLLFYSVGVWHIKHSERNQRLGDQEVGTLVIREPGR